MKIKIYFIFLKYITIYKSTLSDLIDFKMVFYAVSLNSFINHIP